MKKVIFLIFLLPLLFAPSALADIPGIKDTAQYKNLKNYVTFLESKSTTPVSEGQRTTYQNNLNQKVSAAQTRVQSLNTRRRDKVVNRYKRNLKKAIKKINNSRQKNLAEAKSFYRRQIDDENAYYQGELQTIYSKYDGKIASVSKKIKKTEKKLKKAKDLLKALILETKLKALRSQKDSLRNYRAAAKRVAFGAYQKVIKEEKAAHRKRVDRINNRARSSINDQRKTRKKALEGYLGNIAEKKSKEKGLVDSLKSKGQAAIDAMPPVT